MSDRHAWTPEEDRVFTAMSLAGASQAIIAKTLGLTQDQVRWHIRKETRAVEESPFAIHNNPLVMQGDAVVLPDVELPFHHADFLNKVLDLAARWNIRQCIAAGDLLHLASLSAWGSSWMEPSGGIDPKTETSLIDFATTLSAKKKEELLELVMKLAKADEPSNFSEEMREVRKAVSVISEQFDEIHLVLGNHESRYLRALDVPMSPDEILVGISADKEKWKTSPYYYSILETDAGPFQIEHPKSAAKNAAYKLASIHQKHVLMAHSHRWLLEKDPSGKFWAIQMGCIVDETRLPYASQRHNLADTHKLGAVIVRNGYPFLLGEETPFDLL